MLKMMISRNHNNGKTGCCWNKCCIKKCAVCQDADGKIHIEPASSWIILGAAFLLNALYAANETGFSIFYDYFQEIYGCQRSTIGWLFSTQVIVGSIVGLTASSFVKYYGCRPIGLIGISSMAVGFSLASVAPNFALLLVFFGFLGGIGNGCILLATTTIVLQAFTHNRGLATGVSTLGFTLGNVLCPVIVEWFLSNYSVSGALLLYGGLYVQGIVFAALLISPQQSIQKLKGLNTKQSADLSSKQEDLPSDDNVHSVLGSDISGDCDDNDDCPYNDDDTTKGDTLQKQTLSSGKKNRMKDIMLSNVTNFRMLKKKTFLLIMLCFLTFNFARHASFSQIVGAARHQGISPKDAAYLLVIQGICNLVIRVISSVLMNFKRLNPLLYFIFGVSFLAAANVLTTQAKSYNIFIGCLVLMGCNEGAANTVRSLVVVQELGLGAYAQGFSVLRIGGMLGSFVAAPLTGMLIDYTAGYTIAFVVVGLTAFLSICLGLSVHIIRYKQQKQCQDVETHDDRPEQPTNKI